MKPICQAMRDGRFSGSGRTVDRNLNVGWSAHGAARSPRRAARPVLSALAALACAALVACGGGGGGSPSGAGAGVNPLPSSTPTAAPAQNVRVGYPAGDDWEPYMTADASGHLYVVYTHQNAPAHLLVQRSDDGGTTWTAPVQIDPSGTNGQFDPWMSIDPNDGRTVWISYMQGSPASSINVVKSTDLGATWSAPVAVSGAYSNLDKDAMAMRGRTTAICFDNYDTPIAAISQDGGATWTQHAMAAQFSPAPLQFLCSGAGIDSSGTIYFALDRSSSQGSPASPGAEVWIERSSDGGTTWTKTHVGDGGTAYPCANCGAGAFFGSQISLAVGSDDAVYVAWNANDPAANGSAQRIYVARSTDRGTTFSAPADVSSAPAGIEHGFPTVLTGPSAGDVRVGWEDMRTGNWNAFVRASTNGGATWSGETTLSTYAPGYAYLVPTGFLFPYGDYFRMALDAQGRLHAAWGETSAYVNAGTIWVANP